MAFGIVYFSSRSDTALDSHGVGLAAGFFLKYWSFLFLGTYFRLLWPAYLLLYMISLGVFLDGLGNLFWWSPLYIAWGIPWPPCRPFRRSEI